jgi:hypothetical protein
VAGGGPFPTTADARMLAQGTTLLVSFDTEPGGPTYAEIAAGQEDATIRQFLTAVESAAVRYRLGAIYVDFEHEADDASHHAGLGTSAQFVAAWDHVHALAVSAHQDWQQGGRLHWVLILMHTSYTSGLVNQFWPGSSEVDIIAADGYNKGGCQRARLSGTGGQFTDGTTPVVSPGSLFDRAVQFASDHGGMPVFIAEWGSVPYASATVRPAFISQMDQYVAANPLVDAAMYWDSNEAPCEYNVNNSPLSIQALASMGSTRLMQGHLVPVK